MGKWFGAELAPKHSGFIARSRVFFVATAPTNVGHRVNVSPKCNNGAVVVVAPSCVAFLDLSGSGSETAAHIRDNGRITLMFMNIEDGPPGILRLFGHARIVLPAHVSPSLLAQFPASLRADPGFRCVVLVTIERVSDSCGYALPIYQFLRHRTILAEFSASKGSAGMQDYWLLKNSFSIDGLPAFHSVLDPNTLVAPRTTDGYIWGFTPAGWLELCSARATRVLSSLHAHAAYSGWAWCCARAPITCSAGFFFAGLFTGLALIRRGRV